MFDDVRPNRLNMPKSASDLGMFSLCCICIGLAVTVCLYSDVHMLYDGGICHGGVRSSRLVQLSVAG